MSMWILSRLSTLLVLFTFPLLRPVTSQAQTATPVAAAGGQGTVTAAGLANPRGITWGADGALYVAISGSGGDAPGPEGSPFFGGDTAAVAVVRDGAVTMLARGLPSTIWRDIDWVWGVIDIAILGDQIYALEAGGGAVHGNPDTPSGVYTVAADGTTSLVADLGTWVDDNPVANPPPEGAPNGGSFFAMVPVSDDALWVTDAVNGQVLQVTTDGAVTRIADLSEGHPVPTGMAVDPTGGVYVGTLTPAPYVAGSAKVLHVAADGTVTAVWSGLTAVTDVAIGPDGDLYAAELATEIAETDPFLVPGTGRIVHRTGSASMEEVAFELDRPVALRFGPDGALYVAEPAFGADDGSGSIVRLDLDVSVDTSST